jgi:hypothetical protein
MALGLTACMPSQYAYIAETPAKLSIWIDECGRNETNIPAKERYCDLVTNSQGASDREYAYAKAQLGIIDYDQGRYREAISELSEAIKYDASVPQYYENRAYAYEMVDEYAKARSDLEVAGRLTNDPRFGRIADNIDQEARERENARRQFLINYEGFACNKVQRDSVLYPANEIKIQTIVYEVGEALAYYVDLPERGSFGGVDPGHRDNRQAGPIWKGGMGEINLSVVMWEHDDGGPLVDWVALIGVNAAIMAATGKVVPAKPNIYRGGYFVAMTNPRGAPQQAEFSPGLIDGAVGNVMKSVLGTNNDHVGTGHIRRIRVEDYAGRTPYIERGISHHLSTVHRKGGAFCKVFFSVEEIDPLN